VAPNHNRHRRNRQRHDAGEANPTSAVPNIYLDLRTTYATLPADTLSIGLGNPSFARFPALATLSNPTALPNVPNLPTLPALSSPASRNITVDVPLTSATAFRSMAASAPLQRAPTCRIGRHSRS